MSEKVIRICDVVGSGGHAPDDDVRASTRCTYNIEGTTYTIDLCGEHIAPFKLFEQSMAAWANWGTADRTGPRSAGRGNSAQRKRNDANPENTKIREWARENGYAVTERGRIGDDVRAAYQAAHPAPRPQLVPTPVPDHPAYQSPVG